MKQFGANPQPRHLGVVAILCWRAGAYSRAAKYLDDGGVRSDAISLHVSSELQLSAFMISWVRELSRSSLQEMVSRDMPYV